AAPERPARISERIPIVPIARAVESLLHALPSQIGVLLLARQLPKETKAGAMKDRVGLPYRGALAELARTVGLLSLVGIELGRHSVAVGSVEKLTEPLDDGLALRRLRFLLQLGQ